MKLSGFLTSKKKESVIAKKSKDSPLLNTMLINYRAHIVELVLKTIKFDKKY